MEEPKRGELKGRVARGVAWSLAEKVLSAALQVAVSLTILSLLTREDLGIMALLTAVSAVAIVLADSGFSQTLIRKSDPTEGDFKAVFVFNVSVATALYGVFVALAPWAAEYYAMPELRELAPVFFLILPVNALCTVQNTLLVRSFRFALISKIQFAASLLSGAVAIGLALMGWGVWSLVWQRVVLFVLRSVLLWSFGSWSPRGRGDYGALRGMASYSCSLMATDLITTFYTKIPQFFLGRLYTADTLGAFDQAVKLKDQPVTSAVQAVQSVTFPALSKIAEDRPRFSESYRQIVLTVAFVLFPMMFGLSAVAEDLFAALLGEEWMPTVPYLQVVAMAGLFYPISMIAFNVLKVKSGGGLLIRIEILKKVLMTAVFALTIPHSVEAVVWGLVVISFLEMAVNMWAAQRFVDVGVGRWVRTLLPIVAVTLLMYGAVESVDKLLNISPLVSLFVEIGVGVAVYTALSWAFRLEAFGEVKNILLKYLRK